MERGKQTMRRMLTTAILGVAVAQAQIPITLTPTIPASVANNTKPFFRPMFSQLGESCGNASGIGFAFTYEINCARQNYYAYSLFTVGGIFNKHIRLAIISRMNGDVNHAASAYRW